MTTDRSVPPDHGLQPEHLAWFSPSFPVGSFAFSSGLEWAIEAGDIAGAEGLAGWLSDLLDHGPFGNDAILIAATHRSTVAGAADDLAAINDLALALAGSTERRLETVSQGNAFRAMVTAAWHGDFAPLSAGDIAYPVAAGIAAAGRGLSVVPTAFAYLQSVTGALASISVRLGAITQPQAQRLIAGLYPLIGRIAAAAPASSLGDLGSSTFRADLAAIRHETLDGRLFRS